MLPPVQTGPPANLGPFREGRPSFLPAMLCAGFEFTRSEICTKCTPISQCPAYGEHRGGRAAEAAQVVCNLRLPFPDRRARW